MQAPTLQAVEDLPHLEIVHLNDIALHEHHDQGRSDRILARLKDEEMLKNPPVVASVPGSRSHIALDGANRITALGQIGCRDALVQIVDYASAQVSLDTWDHLITGLPGELILEQVRRGGDDVQVAEMSVENIDDLLESREIVCAITNLQDGRHWAVLQGAHLFMQVAHLNRIVDLYRTRGEIYRVDAEHVRGLTHDDRHPTVLFAFPRFTKDEIVALALADVKLPAGITRHLISGRALRINLGLEILRSDAPLEDKNATLRHIIRQKVLDKKVRFYGEPTFLFDE